MWAKLLGITPKQWFYIVAGMLLLGAVSCASSFVEGIQAERDAAVQELADSVAAMGTLKVELTAADLRDQGWVAFAGAPSPDSAMLLRDSVLSEIVRERDVAVNTVVTLENRIAVLGAGVGQVDTVVVEGRPTERLAGTTTFPGLGTSVWSLDPISLAMEERLSLAFDLTFTEGERGGSRFVAVRPPAELADIVTFGNAEHFFGPVEPPVILCDCDPGHHWLWDVVGGSVAFTAGWLLNGGRDDIVVEYVR
jgi:hypothetical protein